jgi:uncharacterized protein YqeY
MSLQSRLGDDMKAALRAHDKDRLSVIRMARAAIKQKEIDERVELDDAQTIAVLEKMIKQRRDSATQYRAGAREDLAAKEEAEIAVLTDYLPTALTDDELEALIADTIAQTGAASMRDMGRVMGQIKTQAAGRADMAVVSARVKVRLTGG